LNKLINAVKTIQDEDQKDAFIDLISEEVSGDKEYSLCLESLLKISI
jgi:hypothetical protein